MSKPDNIVLSFRTATVGGAVSRGTCFRGGLRLSVDDPQWRNARRLVYLLHGFNVDGEEGTRKLDNLAGLLGAGGLDERDVVFSVLWPGDAKWIGPLAYPSQESDADRTATRLSERIRAIRPTGEVHFVAHSLGCRVALETMKQLSGSEVNLASATLGAAAVDADALGRDDRYRRGVEMTNRLHVVRSERDRVLRLAFPVGDLLARIGSRGYTSRALGYSGPKPAPSGEPTPGSVTTSDVSASGVDHGSYLAERLRPLSDTSNEARNPRRLGAFSAAVIQDQTPAWATNPQPP